MVQLLTLLVVCLVATLTAPAEAVFSNTLMQLVRPKLRQCAKDNSVTDAELERIIANDLTNQSPAIQCTSLCFFKKLYMFREDGSINVPASIALFSFGERPCFVSVVSRSIVWFRPC